MKPIQLIVGLGNPGPRYDHTRHNIGFDILDELAQEHALRFKRGWGLKGLHAWWKPGDANAVRLLKPTTFMNASGRAVTRAMRRNRLLPEQVVIVYDDVELPVGRLRIRKKGRAAGHNGIKSIIEELGGEQGFIRVRVGVGPRPSGDKLIDYVLGRWPEEAAADVAASRQRGVEALRALVANGVDRSMNEFNAG